MIIARLWSLPMSAHWTDLMFWLFMLDLNLCVGGCWRSGCVFPSSAYHILPDTLCELCCIRQSKFFVEFLHYEYYVAYLCLSFTTMMGSTRTYCLLPSSTDVLPSPVHRASANLSSSCVIIYNNRRRGRVVKGVGHLDHV